MSYFNYGQKVTEYIASEPLGVLLIEVLILMILPFYKNLFEIFKLIIFRKTRLEKIDKYARRKNVSEVVKEERERLLFKMVTGMSFNRQRRDAVTKLHDSICHAFTWAQIKSASTYFKFDKNFKISIRDRDVLEKWSHRMFKVYGAFLGISSLILFACVMIIREHLSDKKYFGLLILCVMMIPYSLCMISLDRSFIDAQKINKEIKEE